MKKGTKLILVFTWITALAFVIFYSFWSVKVLPTLSFEEDLTYVPKLPHRNENGKNIYPFFYASSRIKEAGSEIKYGSAPADKLFYGKYEFNIPPEYNITDNFKLLEMTRINEMPEDALFSELKNSVEASPSKSLLLVVQGYNNTFNTTSRMTGHFAYWLNMNTPVLQYDWPGDPPGGVSERYNLAKGLTDISAQKLAVLIRDVIKKIGSQKLWIFAHSMGTQVTCEAIEILSREPDFSDLQKEIDHIVFAAPDVSDDQFNENFKHRIDLLTRNFTVYVSSNDDALLASEITNGTTRLGKTGVSLQKNIDTIPQNYEQQKVFMKKDSIDAMMEENKEAQSNISHETDSEEEELVDLLEIANVGDSTEVSIIDATPINQSTGNHRFHMESKEFLNDLYLRLLQGDTFETRQLQRYESKIYRNFWILW